MITAEKISSLLGIKVGVCDFSAVKDRLLPCRKLSLIPHRAKSILLFVFPYKVENEKPKNICRYSAVPDYHKICGEMLENYKITLQNAFKENSFEAFIDNSPIPEVYAAATARLGVVGKNGLLITKEYGSFVFIGEIVTDLEISGENSFRDCINCGECMKKCPVGLDKNRCLSAITQKKGELSQEETRLIKESGCVWGCDICAECCPMNKNGGVTDIKAFKEGYRDSYILGEDISGRAYAWRGEKVINRNFDIIKQKPSF